MVQTRNLRRRRPRIPLNQLNPITISDSQNSLSHDTIGTEVNKPENSSMARKRVRDIGEESEEVPKTPLRSVKVKKEGLKGPQKHQTSATSKGKNKEIGLEGTDLDSEGENEPGLPVETSIDRFVTVGAYCLLRSCTIEPECVIGQHSILMEGSLLRTLSILEAGSMVPSGRRIPSGELWAGNPTRFVRNLTHQETLEIPKLAVEINNLSRNHFSEFLPYSTVYFEVEKEVGNQCLIILFPLFF